MKLFGIARHRNQIAVVMFGEGLVLLEYIAKNPGVDRCQLVKSGGYCLDLAYVNYIQAAQISSGLAYLHKHNIVSAAGNENTLFVN